MFFDYGSIGQTNLEVQQILFY